MYSSASVLVLRMYASFSTVSVYVSGLVQYAPITDMPVPSSCSASVSVLLPDVIVSTRSGSSTNMLSTSGAHVEPMDGSWLNSGNNKSADTMVELTPTTLSSAPIALITPAVA